MNTHILKLKVHLQEEKPISGGSSFSAKQFSSSFKQKPDSIGVPLPFCVYD